MTTFRDGPAKGQHLNLRRFPLFLRVTEKAGKFDALDMLGDTPRPGETLFAYQLAEEPAHGFVDGFQCSGPFTLAIYKIVPEQPSQAILVNRAQWRAWCQQHQ